jgi:hypothetical protein
MLEIEAINLLQYQNMKILKKELKYIYDCSSYLYESDIDSFDSEYNKWMILIDQLNKMFETIGYDKPLWTAFLTENIETFEEVRVLTDCGNFLNVIARSKKYFYFMQYTT